MVFYPDFQPPIGRTNPHFQTLWPTLFRPAVPLPSLQRHRLELQDGDFIDLDWLTQHSFQLVVLFHGLQGSINSGYIRGLMRAIYQQGWSAVVVHFRGCSGEPNRLARSYHAAATDDVSEALAHIRSHHHGAISCVGFSLGANVLLRWLAENPDKAPIDAAVAVSVPFQLQQAVHTLEQGFSRLYQAYLLTQLKAAYREKLTILGQDKLPVDHVRLRRIRTLRDFDHHITAPLHGFASAEDYYQQASCISILSQVITPTLIIHAKDDPFLQENAIPHPAQMPAAIKLQLTDHGGHVGFIQADQCCPYWLEQRIPAFLQTYLTS